MQPELPPFQDESLQDINPSSELPTKLSSEPNAPRQSCFDSTNSIPVDHSLNTHARIEDGAILIEWAGSSYKLRNKWSRELEVSAKGNPIEKYEIKNGRLKGYGLKVYLLYEVEATIGVIEQKDFSVLPKE